MRRNVQKCVASEFAADQAEQSSKAAGKQPIREITPENSSDEIVQVPATPLRAGESQGGATIALAVRTPERLRPGRDLRPQSITNRHLSA